MDGFYKDRGFDINPGVAMPHHWVYLNQPQAVLRKLFRLGHLRAALFFAALPPQRLAAVWRAPPLTAGQQAAWRKELTTVVEEVQGLIDGRWALWQQIRHPKLANAQPPLANGASSSPAMGKRPGPTTAV